MTVKKRNGVQNDGESGYVEALLNDAATMPIDVDVNTYEMHLPPWYDEKKFKRGQQYFKDNLAGAVAAGFCGLISVLAVPSILDVLIFTNRSSSAVTAYKRYVQTILHSLNWYFEELKPGSKAWKSMAYVRRVHAYSGKQANAKNPKMLVSQKDVAITQFGFVGYVVLGYKKLGIQYDQEGMEGFVHVWRTIGYMLGLEDRFNLCAESFDESRQRMVLVNEHFLRPGLQNPSEDFVYMTKVLVEGMWCYSVLLEYDALMFLTRRLSGCPGHQYWDEEARVDGGKLVYKEMGWYSRFMLNVSMTMHEVLLNYALGRWLINWMFVLNTEVNKYFPWLAIVKYGIKNAYVSLVY